MSAVRPQAISTSILSVAGHDLKVYVLEDGRRLIDADDMERLVIDLEGGRARLTPADAKMVRDYLRGGTA